MLKISPSGIGLLLECPLCLWLYANEGIKRPFGIFPSLPGGMDELFKDYFDKYREKGKLPPEIEGKVEGKLYEDMDKLEPWRNINFGRGGLYAQFPDLDMHVRGAIDELMITKDGKYIPFDFKTRGYPTKKDTHKHYQHQLDLYTLLFEKNNLPPADFGYLLFFWPTKYREKSANFKTDLIKLNVSAENGMKILKEVHTIVNNPKPDSHSDCEYCMYRRVGEGFED